MARWWVALRRAAASRQRLWRRRLRRLHRDGMAHWQRRLLRSATWAVVGAAAAFLATAAWRARLTAPAPTLLLVDRHGEFLGELAGEGGPDFGYWPLERLPERVMAATLALEDRRFWLHPGVDPVGLGRALSQNLAEGRTVSGASTIAMQVARLAHPGPRTYLRKALESTTALLLTARYGRQRVLRHYLTIVPYGNRIHGIAYAARRYLDKPVDDLSWAEIAFLAAIPQSPARRNPFESLGSLAAVERGEQILARLAADGVISVLELAVAREEIRRIAIPARGRRPDEALHAVLRFRAMQRDPRMGPALAAVPRVETTLDLDLERRVAWAAWQTVEEWERRGVGNAAVLVVDRERAEVLAAVGSADYFDDRHAGAIDFLSVPRSSGSTLKPFLYALALERGIVTSASLLDDLGPAPGGITNADDRFLGPLLPRFALANSRNVPAVHLLSEVGRDELYTLLGELGLHDGREPASRYGSGLAIGALPVTLERLVGAYTALAGEGRVAELAWFRGQPRAEPRQVISEQTARLVTLFLSDPQARLPSFPRMGWSEYPYAVAVKTGTSSNFRDAWTVAYSGRYLVGVWVGHPDQRPMSEATGYGVAARLAQEVMNALHRDQQDGQDAVSFPPPRGHRGERLCALSGQLATSACDRVTLEWLPPFGERVEPCPVHRPLAVDRRNGLLATAATPAAEVEVRSFVELAPRYASWAADAGLPRPPRQVSALAPGIRHASLTGGPTASGGAAWPASGGPGLLARGATTRLEITSPVQGERLLFDPETPRQRNTLALRVVVDPPVPQVVWYVDGQPFATVDYPFSTRWPLAPGEHAFQARVPFTDLRSGVVRVRVE